MKILNRKTQKEILTILAQNYLIAEDAIKKVEPEKMSAESYFKTMEHLVENTCRAAIRVAGVQGMYAVKEMIDKARKR